MGGGGWNLEVWIWNFGLALPLAVILALKLFFDKEDLETRCFVWTASATFVPLLRLRVCALGMGEHEADGLELACDRTLSLERTDRTPWRFPGAPPSALPSFFQEAFRSIGGLDRSSRIPAWRNAPNWTPGDTLWPIFLRTSGSRAFRTTIIRSSSSDGRSHAATKGTFGATGWTYQDSLCAS